MGLLQLQFFSESIVFLSKNHDACLQTTTVLASQFVFPFQKVIISTLSEEGQHFSDHSTPSSHFKVLGTNYCIVIFEESYYVFRNIGENHNFSFLVIFGPKPVKIFKIIGNDDLKQLKSGKFSWSLTFCEVLWIKCK